MSDEDGEKLIVNPFFVFCKTKRRRACYSRNFPLQNVNLTLFIFSMNYNSTQLYNE